MTNFLSEYGLFLARSLTIVVAILATFCGIITIANKNKSKSKEKVEIIKLNQKYKEIKDLLSRETLEKDELKKLKKKEKHNKEFQKKQGNNTPSKFRTFVLEFDGDIKASAVENLREEITAILITATPKDEVLVKIESSGGTVHGYGLAASQLKRIRDRKIPLIATVDKVAASGGYMVACVADRILAAPFAIIGSIGVIAQLPNFNRLLKKHDIDFEQITAGKYKRTLSLFAENTKEGKEKAQHDVEEAHTLFKNFVSLNRPSVDIEKLATGEIWYGTRAKELGLMDEIMTSDDYLLNMSEKAHIFKVKYTIKKSLAERFALSIQSNISKMLLW
ncbi:MAG: protease SohB [Coxiellaceae bacterium]|jgi:serine protease SohB|nr:protease SohB [Coxiellaceae bacterium]